jgi:hypothetical protein
MIQRKYVFKVYNSFEELEFYYRRSIIDYFQNDCLQNLKV